jgi:hypothetical protein
VLTSLPNFGVRTPIFPDYTSGFYKELFWECKSRGMDWNKKEKVWSDISKWSDPYTIITYKE